MKKHVLFVCTHNSARSQMAEELFRKANPDAIVESAGVTPGELNPLAIEVLLEEGIDIRGKQTQDVFQIYKEGHLYSHVITVCDDSREHCPIFPGPGIHDHWSFPDPSKFTGTTEEQLEQTRNVREAIKLRIREWTLANH